MVVWNEPEHEIKAVNPEKCTIYQFYDTSCYKKIEDQTELYFIQNGFHLTA